MMKCDDVIQQRLDRLTKRMLDTAKLDKEKISKSSKAMKLAKKFMGNMEKASGSEDRQKRIIGMIDKFYKLNASYWESEASEDDDTDSEDDDFEGISSCPELVGLAEMENDNAIVLHGGTEEAPLCASVDKDGKLTERFNKPNELKASVWESELFEDDDFIGRFNKEMYSESEASEDDDFEELFFPGVKAIKNTKMKCDDVIQHSDKFEKLKKRMMGNTSLNEEKASEGEGISSCPELVSSCPELVGLVEMENDNAIVLRGGTEAPLCASVDEDGKLTKSRRIAFG